MFKQSNKQLDSSDLSTMMHSSRQLSRLLYFATRKLLTPNSSPTNGQIKIINISPVLQSRE